MYVVDRSDLKVFAYKMNPGGTDHGNRDAGKDITLASGNGNPRGVWGNADTVWVVEDGSGNRIYAYNRSDGSHNLGKDFSTLHAAGNQDPWGIWSDGVHMWVVDSDDDKVYAYKMSDMSRDPVYDFDLHSDNGNPQGLWSDGQVFFVADPTDDAVYIYVLEEVLVSNLDQVSAVSSSAVYFTNSVAQAFTTGAHAIGYSLGSVDIDVHTAPQDTAAVSVRIFTDSSGEPDSFLCTLDKPSTITAGVNTFPASHCASLAAGTTYHIIVSSSLGSSDTFQLRQTTSTAQSGARGWTIGQRQSGDVGSPWTAQAGAHKIAVIGAVRSEIDLDSANDEPRGVWGNSTTIWVAHDGPNPDNKIFAYNLDGTRNSDEDFETLHDAGNRNLGGIWSDGTTMFVVDHNDDKVYAYNLSTKAHDGVKDITLAGSHNDPTGIWGDSTTIWVGNDGNSAENKIYAYKRSDGSHDPVKDFNKLNSAGNQHVRGIWSDGTTMWVADSNDDKVYAYNTSDENRNQDHELDLVSDNSHPYGMWSDGTTLHVVDSDDDKIYFYDLPGRAANVDATGAPLVEGTPQVGEVLTAETHDIVDENGLPGHPQDFSYRWQRSDDGSTDWTGITGATAPHYYPTDADVGKHLRVQVSFRDGDDYPEGPLNSAGLVTTGPSTPAP